jgi:PPOX class probable F420-dependent enzyme
MTTPGYGFEKWKSPPGVKFPWHRVEELLTKARNYWIATASPDGRPHMAPVWGMWVDNVFYFSTGPKSRKARNFRRNPQVSVHPECDNEAVIIEGRVELLDDVETLKPLYAVYKEKYDWDMSGEVLYAVRPTVVYSFKEDLVETAARWDFASNDG